ncbi:MAG: hypothetical protein M3144_03715 [Actinomycetota bacterium]|nr:hypothetical protein [Actinomycetota bacterium]
MGAGLIAPTTIPPPRRTWSDAEWERLRKGPVRDDWVGVLVGDRLELSRSGRAIYGARFRRELTGWKIVAAEVEGDPTRNRPERPERESERLQFLIERLLG